MDVHILTVYTRARDGKLLSEAGDNEGISKNNLHRFNGRGCQVTDMGLFD